MFNGAMLLRRRYICMLPRRAKESNARRQFIFLQREFEKRVDPNDKSAQALLEEMRQHVKKVGSLSCV